MFFEPFEPRTLLTSFYVSPTGNDSLAGTSPATAWKTIAKANTVDLNAGDQLLLQGGTTFTAPAASSTNQVGDSGFESGNFNTWNQNYDATAGNSSINTTASNLKSGTRSLRVGGTGAGGRGQLLTSKLQANKSYLLKFWAKLSSGSGGAYAGVTFRSGSNIVGYSNVRIYGTSFTQYSVALVAPASFDSAELWITKQDGSSVLYADDVSLNETYGTLIFNASDSGTSASPVTIGSYGSGRATIAAGDGHGLWAGDVSGFEVEDLNFTGNWNGLAATGTNGGSGVAISNRLSNNTKLSYIRINNVDASGFKWAGVSVSGDSGKSGYNDVDITNTYAHDNGDIGIRVEGTFNASSTSYSHSDVYVAWCKAYNNGGLPNKLSNSGNGILIGDTNGAVIERNIAWNNGQNCNHTGGGPVGIWAWDSNAVYIQYNEAYGNKTGSVSLDGGGFDLDGGCTNSFLQYNYSHDNYGAGYLLYQFTGARTFGNNTVRYNISQNDARDGHYAGIYMGGGSGVANNQIYNNVVYMTPTGDTSIAAIKFTGIGTNNKFRNNVFVTTGSVRLLDSNSAYSTSSVLFQGNDWYSSGATFAIKWGGTTYSDLSTWRGTGQEKNGSTLTGKSIVPSFINAGNAPTLGDASKLNTLTHYQLDSASQLINGGVNLASFGVNPGLVDFFGNAMPVGVTDTGAFEYTPAPPAPPPNPVANGTAGDDTFVMRLGTGGMVELFINTPTTSSPTVTWNKSTSTTFTINGNGGADVFELDLSNGNPLPTGGATFNGSGATDTIIVRGSSGNDTIALASSSVTPGGSGPAFSYVGVGDVEVITGSGNDVLHLTASGTAASAAFNLGDGNDALSINAGTYTFNADAAVVSPNLALTVAAGAYATFNTSQHFASLTLNGNATLAAGGDKVLVTKSLTLAPSARLDLSNNSMIIDHDGASPLGEWNGVNYTGVTGMVASGRNGGSWNGSGIVASYAVFGVFRYTLGVAEASDALGIAPFSFGNFMGETVDSTAVLIRYTLSGDANLDGRVDGIDYSRSTNGRRWLLTGFANGDFDYSGVLDADDLFVLYSNYGKVL